MQLRTAGVCIFSLMIAAGCLSTHPSAISGNSSGYVFAGAGASKFDVDTLNDTLTVSKDVSAAAHIGLGYQFNQFSALEFRAADLGAVEFEDGRELGYQVLDASALLIYRQSKASVFARLGIGTFKNPGDFETTLESPVHAALGGGIAYHATPNIDVRLSASGHDADAVWGDISLVWRFGQNKSSPRIIVDQTSAPEAVESPEQDTAVIVGETQSRENSDVGNDGVPDIDLPENNELSVQDDSTPQNDSAVENELIVQTVPREAPTSVETNNAQLVGASNDTSTAVQEASSNNQNGQMGTTALQNDTNSASFTPPTDDDLPTVLLLPGDTLQEEPKVAVVPTREPNINTEVNAEIDTEALDAIGADADVDAETETETETETGTGTGTGTGAELEARVDADPEADAEIEGTVENEVGTETGTEQSNNFVTGTLLPIGPLQFVVASLDLEENSMAKVPELVEFLNANSELNLSIEAHVAPVGDAELNMLLSRRRALAVIRILIEQGIAATRLRPQAFGDTAPIEGAQSLSEHDRVELRVRE